jgi:hypothetical protein
MPRALDPVGLVCRPATASQHRLAPAQPWGGGPLARPLLDLPIIDNDQKIGIADIPIYERWGHGKLFTRLPYGMPIHPDTLQSNKMDAFGARILIAVWIWDASSHYRWRQVVRISNQDDRLVDVAQHDADNDGRFDVGSPASYYDWKLDHGPNQSSDWYYDSQAEQSMASQQNSVYWAKRGKTVVSNRFHLLEDNPIQPIQLVARTGPFGLFPEPRRHGVTGMALAQETSTVVKLKFATSLVAVDDPGAQGGGRVVFKVTWGFEIRSDESWSLYPLRPVG